MSGLRLPVPRWGRLVAAAAAVAALVVAGCGSGSASGGGSGGNASASSAAKGATLTVADVAPFTGTDAALGPTYLVSCDAATNAINAAGGRARPQAQLQVGGYPRRPG